MKGNLTLLLFISILFVSINVKTDFSSIQGSWELIQYKYGEDANFSEVPDFIKYVKHVTETHYTWVSYQKDGDEIIGSGGGRYEMSNGKYIETIEFFHPHGSNLIGTSVIFNSKLENNIWSISGYIKDIKLDPATGEYLALDSIKLHEKWKRLL